MMITGGGGRGSHIEESSAAGGFVIELDLSINLVSLQYTKLNQPCNPNPL
jgi:hypothetical protein